MSKLPISVVMLTLNEEANLPGALENLADFAEEVFIVDSLSTDRTIDIALEHGAQVVQRRFRNFGDQWNFALERLPITTPWTLKLDPDERLSNDLKAEIEERIKADPPETGFWIERRLWFLGEPLNLKQWVLRLWKTGRCHFSDVIVNEVPVVEGETAYLGGLMEHLDSPTLHHWLDKQNLYSTMEAIMKYQGAKLATPPKLFGNEAERRAFFKKIFYRVPFRYFVIWCYHALWQRAFFAGPEGRAWVRLRLANYYRAIADKVADMERTGRVLELPQAPHGDFDPRIVESPLQREILGSESGSAA